MHYPLTVPGMEGHVIEVTTARLGRPPSLLIDGLSAPPGQEKGEYLIFRPDGTMTTVRLTGHLLDIVPKVSVNGQSLVLTEPLQWYEWLLIVLPLALVFLGLPGILFGTAAAIGSLLIFRSGADAVFRCLGAFGIAVTAFAAVFSLVLIMRAQDPTGLGPNTPRHTFFHLHSHTALKPGPKLTSDPGPIRPSDPGPIRPSDPGPKQTPP